MHSQCFHSWVDDRNRFFGASNWLLRMSAVGQKIILISGFSRLRCTLQLCRGFEDDWRETQLWWWKQRKISTFASRMSFTVVESLSRVINGFEARDRRLAGIEKAKSSEEDDKSSSAATWNSIVRVLLLLNRPRVHCTNRDQTLE